MTTMTAVSVVQHIIERAWNDGDLAVIDETVTPAYIRHTRDGDWSGPELSKERIPMLRAALSGVHSEIAELGGETGRAFCRFTVTGRHGGELPGFPPTGNPVRFDGCVIAHAENGRLTEEWEFVDTMAFMAQLGGKLAAVRR